MTDRTFLIIDINDHGAAIFKYIRSELLNKPIDTLICPSHICKHEQALST